MGPRLVSFRCYAFSVSLRYSFIAFPLHFVLFRPSVLFAFALLFYLFRLSVLFAFVLFFYLFRPSPYPRSIFLRSIALQVVVLFGSLFSAHAGPALGTFSFYKY